MDNTILNLLERMLTIPDLIIEKEVNTVEIGGISATSVRVFSIYPPRMMVASYINKGGPSADLWIAGQGEHRVSHEEACRLFDAREKAVAAKLEKLAADWLKSRLNEVQ